MSDDVVIRAKGLGKKYVIGHEERERYVALRDVLARTAKGVWRKTADMARGRPIVVGDRTEDFWALKDVSFEVRRGEVLGVIGRNGAGKSTLLKILSRITDPTEGRVTIAGRVASLLEVGTGFHPELTGRENVYLNGAILGMTRAEIKRKFDEIVDFAGVERFLDTPVKRYSSGMQVRLAFAVAAHLEPEILVVDEVLAVGDAEFQKKCLGKMEDVASHGRTVLFVSHNMAAVSALCTGALTLNAGMISHSGRVAEVLASYLADGDATTTRVGRQIDMSGDVRTCRHDSATAVVLVFDVTLRGRLAEPRVGIGIDHAGGVRVATIFSETAMKLPPVAEGKVLRFRIETEPVRLAPGSWLIKLALAESGRDIETHEDAIRLVVPNYSPFQRPGYGPPRGPVLMRHRIRIDESPH
ncbi:MAG: ATP-binding cassette domain-containing protein [bacterium]|nr:ATP-binding cassette domain-containing protein [bacterium]